MDTEEAELGGGIVSVKAIEVVEFIPLCRCWCFDKANDCALEILSLDWLRYLITQS